MNQPSKPQPLTAEQAKALVAQAMLEMGHEASFAEKLKMAALINHLYEQQQAVLVIWPR